MGQEFYEGLKALIRKDGKQREALDEVRKPMRSRATKGRDEG
jgi:hypothetical protein